MPISRGEREMCLVSPGSGDQSWVSLQLRPSEVSPNLGSCGWGRSFFCKCHQGTKHNGWTALTVLNLSF